MKIPIRYQSLGLTAGVRGVAVTLGSGVVVALLRPDRLLSFMRAGYRFRP